MTKSSKVSALLNGQQIIPVVVIEDEAQALGLAQALLDGGVNVIEITLRHQFGLSAIKLIKQAFPDMVVLAGTVNDLEDLNDVVNADVDGVISPGLTSSLAQGANELGIPYLPGVATASELLIAKEYGLTECKLFPATVVGGVAALKAFSGPFNDIRFCPTGGVSEKNFKDFLALDNVMCVGGSWIAPSSLIRQHDWSTITQLCRDAIG